MPKFAPTVELFRTDDYYIFHNGEHSLWYSRSDGTCEAKSGWDLVSANNPECLGVLYGIVGKIEEPSVLSPRLMLIRQYEYVGDLPGNHAVFKVKAISLLPLTGPDLSSQELGLHPCTKHRRGVGDERGSSTSGGIFDIRQPALAKTWGTIKSATNTIKNTTQHAAALATAQVKPGKKREAKELDRFERRIVEELHKLIVETDSFYFTHSGDLTNSLQRQWKRKAQQQHQQPNSTAEQEKEEEVVRRWQHLDDRFFWNVHMLRHILDLNNPAADMWVLPVIQGFVQMQQCKVDVGSDRHREAMEPQYEMFTLTLISRRSRFRAGTRYNRRGVDDSGQCANYVETEQIISYHEHQVSFVQVRGSVPVLWSQPGYKYRPPPKIDKGETETQLAFEKHFHEELSIYGPVCIVNLVEQSGRERVIADAYAKHVFNFNCPDLTYVTFDFHEYCRGMHFENVSVLVAALLEVIQELRFCWIDCQGLICLQSGTFRVNCIDCLDRTNVVQTFLARTVMEIVFTKLGLIAPEGTLPASIRNTFQQLWANNGDTISRQYAGTNALKGDYTRTGERKFTGMMKDGMNSANRYYLSRFRDMYRQAAIDLMLGNDVSEDLLHPERSAATQEAEDLAATAEHVKLLMEDCKKMLLSESEVVLGAWGLIDADPITGDPSETEMDTILILTPESYYVASYDDASDRVTSWQRVLLEDLRLIELGTEQSTTSLFKSPKLGSGCCIRLNYQLAGEPGYFHMFRSTNLRFFNNMAVAIRNEEEIVESMKAVCESFSVALEMRQLPVPVPVQHGGRLEKRKSKQVASADRRSYLDMGNTSSLPHMTRNLSENQLLVLKSVGTKAISNVTQQFNKLNKLSLRNSFNTRKVENKKLTTENKEQAQLAVEEEGLSAGPSKQSSTNDLDELMQLQPPVCGHVRCADLVLPSCGILAGQLVTAPRNVHLARLAPFSLALGNAAAHDSNTDPSLLLPPGRGLTHSRSDLSLSSEGMASRLTPSPHRTITPEITVNAAPATTAPPPSAGELADISRHISRSSGDVDQRAPPSAAGKKVPAFGNLLGSRRSGDGSRSASECDLSTNMTSSQSESALKSLRGGVTSVLTSPSSTRDLMLSPLSRLARGVQNLGANLDPRKLTSRSGGGAAGTPTAEVSEDYRRLQDKWKNCRTRLIAL